MIAIGVSALLASTSFGAARVARAQRPVWTGADGRPTAQARAAIAILRDAGSRGLRPADYDAGAIAAQAAELGRGTDGAAATAAFGDALTRAMVRFITHLHEGRVSPEAMGFHLPDAHRNVDFAAMALAVSRAADVRAAITAAEPPYLGYAALERTLGRYRTLANDTALANVPLPTRTLRPGDRFAGASALRRFLTALGDATGSAATAAAADITYDATLADAVRRFQRRHGLDVDGVLGRATRAQLRVPLAARVTQMELTLERWRWLPDVPPARYAVVNIPAFRLYVFEDDRAGTHPELRMNVIIGRADQRRLTPVFAGTMREVVFRPYWDVPLGIVQREEVPRLRRNPGYAVRQSLEIVSGGESDARVYAMTGANLDRVASGSLRLRQRPGPSNALGLVKFVFPNAYSVYMHGTPAQELFSRARRDFSHGCIRVEDPPSLAALVLRGQPGWDAAAIDSAMHGSRTVHVPIERPLGVFVLYATAVVATDGTVYFYPDLYGRDAILARALRAAAPAGDTP